MNLKRKDNYFPKFIEMEQDVNDVDVDVNETCLSVPTVEKWSERVIKGGDKSKTLTSNISCADVNRSKATTIIAARAGAGPTTDRQSDSLKDKILSANYLELSSKDLRS